MVFPLITRSDGTFAVPHVLRVFFAVELSTWRSTSSIRQLPQKVGFESTCLVVSWPSQGSNNSKDRSAGGGKKSQQKMGVSFLSSFTWTYLEKMPQLRWKQYQRSRCEMNWSNWSPVSCHDPWINGERIKLNANPIGLVTSWAYFRVEIFLQKGRTCLSIRKGGWLVGWRTQYEGNFEILRKQHGNSYEQVQVQERIIEAQVRRQETQETWNVCQGFRF